MPMRTCSASRRRREPGDGSDNVEAGPHDAFDFVLVRARIAEIGQQPVAHELGNETAMARDHDGAGFLVGADHLAHVLGIEPGRQRRRAGEIAEHDRELPAFGLGLWLRYSFRRRGRSGSCRQGREYAFAVSESETQLLEIAVSQRRQDIEIDAVFLERRFEARQANTGQPFLQGCRRIHADIPKRRRPMTSRASSKRPVWA